MHGCPTRPPPCPPTPRCAVDPAAAVQRHHLRPDFRHRAPAALPAAGRPAGAGRHACLPRQGAPGRPTGTRAVGSPAGQPAPCRAVPGRPKAATHAQRGCCEAPAGPHPGCSPAWTARRRLAHWRAPRMRWQTLRRSYGALLQPRCCRLRTVACLPARPALQCLCLDLPAVPCQVPAPAVLRPRSPAGMSGAKGCPGWSRWSCPGSYPPARAPCCARWASWQQSTA